MLNDGCIGEKEKGPLIVGPMDELSDGVYLPTDDPYTFASTPLANAGWYDEGQHGGALAALIAGHIETIPTLTPMQVTRLTIDMFRVVPLVPLTLETSVIREGKRIQVLETRVLSGNTEYTRATVQRIRVDDVGLPEGVSEDRSPFPPPESLEGIVPGSWGLGPEGKVMFHRHAIEVREIAGGFHTTESGSLWMRLTTPVIAGAEITPLQRLVVPADFCNGVSRLTLDPHWLFMNPDLSVNVNRLPQGEWVALEAHSRYSPNGRGIATGTLWDNQGYLGESTQTLYLDRTGNHQPS